MVTYIWGNSIKKRAQFSKINNDEEIYIDDMRIACDVIRDGVYCYALEDRLFKKMRVGDFVSYSRIMFDNEATNVKHVKKMLKSVGYRLGLGRKLSALSDSDYLKILFVARAKETTRSVYLNLDGWQFNRKNARRMKKLTEDLSDYSVCVLVSDLRFCKYGDDVLYFGNGELTVVDGEMERKKMSKRKLASLLKTECVSADSGA
ncbi:MAG: hypothetical protein J6C23_03855 [Clostridia bacterium]|nr:hypothetical protein [Clostridia bacterium]